MTDHFVRHVIADEGRVTTRYRCTAPEDAPCRTVCQRCIVDEQREQCQCEYVTESGDWDESETETVGREPVLITGGPCNILAWLENDGPDECYCGTETEVRGPDWQPITAIWESEYYQWEYADA